MRHVGPTSVALCDGLTGADECVEGGDASLYRMVPYGSDAWPRAYFGPPRCVWVWDLTDPKLVLATLSVGKVYRVVYTAREAAWERPRARTEFA